MQSLLIPNLAPWYGRADSIWLRMLCMHRSRGVQHRPKTLVFRNPTYCIFFLSSSVNAFDTGRLDILCSRIRDTFCEVAA